MQRHLIVNADDFGYSYSINRGIIEAHEKGIVTSTSVMVDAIAAEEAKELLNYPNLSVGLHFELKSIVNVEAELTRQVGKFVTILGVMPDHIDTHKNHPNAEGIKEVLLGYSKEHNIPVRDFGYIKFIDSFFGMHSNGDVSVAQFKKAIDQATDDYNEIMTHVGYCDDYIRGRSSYNELRETELQSICDPEIKRYIIEKGLILSNWKSLVI